jgi:hypothetical protein
LFFGILIVSTQARLLDTAQHSPQQILRESQIASQAHLVQPLQAPVHQDLAVAEEGAEAAAEAEEPANYKENY